MSEKRFKVDNLKYSIIGSRIYTSDGVEITNPELRREIWKKLKSSNTVPIGADGSKNSAEDTSYDNSHSGLYSTNVQDAIDEIRNRPAVSTVTDSSLKGIGTEASKLGLNIDTETIPGNNAGLLTIHQDKTLNSVPTVTEEGSFILGSHNTNPDPYWRSATVSPTSDTIPIRSESGTVKVADGVDDNDAVNVKQLNNIVSKSEIIYEQDETIYPGGVNKDRIAYIKLIEVDDDPGTTPTPFIIKASGLKDSRSYLETAIPQLPNEYRIFGDNSAGFQSGISARYLTPGISPTSLYINHNQESEKFELWAGGISYLCDTTIAVEYPSTPIIFPQAVKYQEYTGWTESYIDTSVTWNYQQCSNVANATIDNRPGDVMIMWNKENKNVYIIDADGIINNDADTATSLEIEGNGTKIRKIYSFTKDPFGVNRIYITTDKEIVYLVRNNGEWSSQIYLSLEQITNYLLLGLPTDDYPLMYIEYNNYKYVLLSNTSSDYKIYKVTNDEVTPQYTGRYFRCEDADIMPAPTGDGDNNGDLDGNTVDMLLFFNNTLNYPSIVWQAPNTSYLGLMYDTFGEMNKPISNKGSLIITSKTYPYIYGIKYIASWEYLTLYETDIQAKINKISTAYHVDRIILEGPDGIYSMRKSSVPNLTRISDPTSTVVAFSLDGNFVIKKYTSGINTGKISYAPISEYNTDHITELSVDQSIVFGRQTWKNSYWFARDIQGMKRGIPSVSSDPSSWNWIKLEALVADSSEIKFQDTNVYEVLNKLDLPTIARIWKEPLSPLILGESMYNVIFDSNYFLLAVKSSKWAGEYIIARGENLYPRFTISASIQGVANVSFRPSINSQAVPIISDNEIIREFHIFEDWILDYIKFNSISGFEEWPEYAFHIINDIKSNTEFIESKGTLTQNLLTTKGNESKLYPSVDALRKDIQGILQFNENVEFASDNLELNELNTGNLLNRIYWPLGVSPNNNNEVFLGSQPGLGWSVKNLAIVKINTLNNSISSWIIPNRGCVGTMSRVGDFIMPVVYNDNSQPYWVFNTRTESFSYGSAWGQVAYTHAQYPLNFPYDFQRLYSRFAETKNYIWTSSRNSSLDYASKFIRLNKNTSVLDNTVAHNFPKAGAWNEYPSFLMVPTKGDKIFALPLGSSLSPMKIAYFSKENDNLTTYVNVDYDLYPSGPHRIGEGNFLGNYECIEGQLEDGSFIVLSPQGEYMMFYYDASTDKTYWRPVMKEMYEGNFTTLCRLQDKSGYVFYNKNNGDVYYAKNETPDDHGSLHTYKSSINLRSIIPNFSNNTPVGVWNGWSYACISSNSSADGEFNYILKFRLYNGDLEYKRIDRILSRPIRDNYRMRYDQSIVHTSRIGDIKIIALFEGFIIVNMRTDRVIYQLFGQAGAYKYLTGANCIITKDKFVVRDDYNRKLYMLNTNSGNFKTISYPNELSFIGLTNLDTLMWCTTVTPNNIIVTKDNDNLDIVKTYTLSSGGHIDAKLMSLNGFIPNCYDQILVYPTFEENASDILLSKVTKFTTPNIIGRSLSVSLFDNTEIFSMEFPEVSSQNVIKDNNININEYTIAKEDAEMLRYGCMLRLPFKADTEDILSAEMIVSNDDYYGLKMKGSTNYGVSVVTDEFGNVWLSSSIRDIGGGFK